MSVNLSFEEFRELSDRYNVIPVYKEILSDLDTPLSVFQKIFSPERFSFLFESVEQGDNIGRYSFIGSSLPVYIKTKRHLSGEVLLVISPMMWFIFMSLYLTKSRIPSNYLIFFSFSAMRLWFLIM